MDHGFPYSAVCDKLLIIYNVYIKITRRTVSNCPYLHGAQQVNKRSAANHEVAQSSKPFVASDKMQRVAPVRST